MCLRQLLKRQHSYHYYKTSCHPFPKNTPKHAQKPAEPPQKTALCALTAITLAATTLTLTTLQNPTSTQAQPGIPAPEKGNNHGNTTTKNWDTDNLDFNGETIKAGTLGFAALPWSHQGQHFEILPVLLDGVKVPSGYVIIHGAGFLGQGAW